MTSFSCLKMKIMKPPIENPTFFDLPDQIMIDILSSLPTKSIMSCKLVCKLWCSIVKHPQFNKSSKSITVLVRRALDNHGIRNLHFLEPEFGYTERIRNKLPCLMLGNETLTKFNDGGFNDLPVKMLGFVNSCKGLVCLELKRYVSLRKGEKITYDPYLDPYFICNPATSDFVVVQYPGCKENSSDVYRYAGLGFCSKSGRYKVVRFTDHWKKREAYGKCFTDVDVCTLDGDHQWRRLKSRPANGTWGSRQGMFFEGALHWIVRQLENGPSAGIVVFNCQEENFGLIDLPDDDASRGFKIRGLAILHSQLCFCVKVSNLCCAIWVMEEYGIKESWRKLFVVSSTGGDDSINHYLMPFKPLAYLNNGDILMLSITGQLFAYDVKSNTWRAIKIPGVAAKIEAMLLDPVFIPTKDLLLQGKEDTE